MTKPKTILSIITPLLSIGVMLLFSCQEPLILDSDEEMITLKSGNMPTDVQQGDLYGDLWELERDLHTGIPEYYDLEYYAEVQDVVKTGFIDVINPRLKEGFTLKITCRNVDGTIIFDDGDKPKTITYTVTLNSNGFMELSEDAPTPAVLYDLEGEILPEVSLHVYPVEEGRLNIIRSPSTVLSKRMTEVIKNFGDGTVAQVIRDYCGRFYMLRTDGALELGYEDKPIDSPLENLALYYELMINGFNNDEDKNGIEFLVRSDTGFGFESRLDSEWGNGSSNFGDLNDTNKEKEFVANLAAACVAAGSDKSNDITLDELIFLNQFMGIPKVDETGNVTSYFDYEPVSVRMLDKMTKEVITKTRYFIDYSNFNYNRSKFDDTLIDLWSISDENGDGVYEETEVATGLSLGDMLNGTEPNTAGFLSGYGYTVSDNDLVTEGAQGFANQANDYVQALELIHNNEEFLKWEIPTPTWLAGENINRSTSPFIYNYVEPDHSKKPDGKGDVETEESPVENPDTTSSESSSNPNNGNYETSGGSSNTSTSETGTPDTNNQSAPSTEEPTSNEDVKSKNNGEGNGKVNSDNNNTSVDSNTPTDNNADSDSAVEIETTTEKGNSSNSNSKGKKS